MPGTELTIRARRLDDLGVLVALLAEIHQIHGYPANPAFVRADFIASPDEFGAWVATCQGRLVGHVSLLAPAGVSAPLWRAATGRDDNGIAVVSRLFSRATGAGSALLRTAIEAAREADRVPVLEVERDSAARGFYLRRGWRAVGEVRQHWREPFVTVTPMILTDEPPAGPDSRGPAPPPA
jgi:GNAT superfamily N-acetyltransferase